jgi:hypothetical protein
LTLPGRNVESVTIEPHHIMPKKDLRRPIPDVIKDINRKSRASITMSSAANGRLKFDATGPQDVAQQALKELVRQIGTKVRVVPTPIFHLYRRHMVKPRNLTSWIDHRPGCNSILLPRSYHWQARLDHQGHSRTHWRENQPAQA